MKALIRGTETIKEPFNAWVKSHINYLIECDGWILDENYNLPEEKEEP